MSLHTDLTVSRGSRRSSLPSILLSVVFGTAAGIVGTLVALAYVAPGFTPSIAFPIRGNEAQERAAEFITPEAFTAARRAAVTLSVTRGPAAALGGAYAPGESTGSGMVLTSDGWIVTANEVSVTRPQDTSAIIGGRAYPVQKVIVDGYSGVRFLKVDAANLPVNAFASGDLAVGSGVYLPDAAGGVVRAAVRMNGLLPAATADGLVRSSEQLQQVVLLDRADGAKGAMALNVRGEAVGLLGDASAFGRVVIPVSAFVDVMDDVLRDGRANRPVLGVHYMDLSVARAATEGVTRGALLTGSPDGKRLAVLRKSAAESSGLRQGDIITAVNGYAINAENPLSSVVAGYAVGDSATFSVLRGRLPAEISVTVTFGTAP